MDYIKETAEFFRYGLLLGLHSVSDAMAWIDATLIAESAPDNALIEASLCGRRGTAAVAEWLAHVSGQCDTANVARRLCGAMFVRLQQDAPFAPKAARWLYQMALDGYVPDKEAEHMMWYFDDALSLENDGICGDAEEIVGEIFLFLSRYNN